MESLKQEFSGRWISISSTVPQLTFSCKRAGLAIPRMARYIQDGMMQAHSPPMWSYDSQSGREPVLSILSGDMCKDLGYTVLQYPVDLL